MTVRYEGEGEGTRSYLVLSQSYIIQDNIYTCKLGICYHIDMAELYNTR